MKAWILNALGDIRCTETDVPEAKDNEVLIHVRAAGICGSDIPRIYKSGAYFYPLITGHEFSGQVVSVGTGADERWIGKRVGISPLIPCGKCSSCQKKLYEMCKGYSYLGSRRNGGFAEYVSVPAKNLIELPDSVPYEDAAMMEPMAVSVHAIRRVSPTPNDNVVICGLGTIGMMILMFLLESGIKNIFVIGNKELQRKTAVQMGLPAENYCNSTETSTTEWLKEKTQGKGADVFFECVGKSDIINLAVDSAAAGGRIMLVGNPYSDLSMEKTIYWKILRNQLIVTGTWNSTFTNEDNDDWHYVLKKLAEEKIHPSALITHRLELASFEKGLHIMRDKSEDYIKVMMVNK